MSLEQKLNGWTGPSSDTEQEKQERTERMVRAAIAEHPPFAGCNLSVYAKGSYANNTNVRADSDVDIAVECQEAYYWREASPGIYTSSGVYTGPWTPARLRAELIAALTRKFPTGVDCSGTTAIRVASSSARVDADVVPCFGFRYYLSAGSWRSGTKIFRKDGSEFENYPAQQLANGREKNRRTGFAFKKAVRVLKRIENAMVEAGASTSLPSYFVECLAYNCPDTSFMGSTWTAIVRANLLHVWNSLQGDEPADASQRWLEVNECLYLFHTTQKWTRSDGRSFAQAAWHYLGLQ